MLIFWQALAFTACALLDLLPSTEVQCSFGVSVMAAPPAPPEPPQAASTARTAPRVRTTSTPSGSSDATRSAEPACQAGT